MGLYARKYDHDQIRQFAKQNPDKSLSQIAKNFGMTKSGLAAIIGRRPQEDRMNKIMQVVQEARQLVHGSPATAATLSPSLREAVLALDA